MKKSFFILGLTFLGLSNSFARGGGPAPSQKPSRESCRYHIYKEELSKGLELGLLEAIAQIESKLSPLSVNAAGKAYNFKTVEEATKFIRTKQEEGYRNISVGPMQLHLPSHRQNFNSLEDMLDPQKNISYAATLIKKLQRQTGSTEKAVKLYHSPNPQANKVYKDRVFGAWAKIRKRNKEDIHPVSLKKEKKSDAPAFTMQPSKKSPLKIKFAVGAIISKPKK